MKGESIIDLGGVNSSSAVDLTDQIHQLPCCIKFNGPSPVSHYFKPKSTGVEVDALNVKEAHFRGRKLQGTTVTLPHGYSDELIL
ncbi:putative ribonuclease H2, subunit C [Helianthus annuus]|nr:putative ribonuclease H2, subunit C [Helianthus annuus]